MLNKRGHAVISALLPFAVNVKDIEIEGFLLNRKP